jgi:hypothetical protein
MVATINGKISYNNFTCIIMIIGTLWMLFLILDTQQSESYKNLGTFKVKHFIPKPLESYSKCH